jgi:hypothetical protein
VLSIIFLLNDQTLPNIAHLLQTHEFPCDKILQLASSKFPLKKLASSKSLKSESRSL